MMMMMMMMIIIIIIIIIQDIPSTVGQLKSLVILNIDKNRLTTIPAEVTVRNSFK